MNTRLAASLPIPPRAQWESDRWIRSRSRRATWTRGTSEAILKKMEAALTVASTHPDMIKVSKAVDYPIRFCTAEQARNMAEESWDTIKKTSEATGYEAK